MRPAYPTHSFWRKISASAVAISLSGLTAGEASAAGNTPCSGKKGGIERCQGERFICRDGSISGSKKSCSTTRQPLSLLNSSPQWAPTTNTTTCSCRSGMFCTGPRGGRFCLSDNGQKSYMGK